MLEHERPERKAEMPAPDLSDLELATIRVVQHDLANVERPFAVYAEQIGIGATEDDVLDVLRSLKERKLMRRFAAVMNHRSAGFKANAMGVWAVPDDRLDEIGPQMAGFAAVSHCYRRPTYDDWPYSVFTMVHGRTARDCEATIDAIRTETGVDEYCLLWSVKEYKKVRLEYFTPEWDTWYAKHATPTRSARPTRRVSARRRGQPPRAERRARGDRARAREPRHEAPVGRAGREQQRLVVRVLRLPARALEPVVRDDERVHEVRHERRRRVAEPGRPASPRARASRARAGARACAGSASSAPASSYASQPSAATLYAPSRSTAVRQLERGRGVVDVHDLHRRRRAAHAHRRATGRDRGEQRAARPRRRSARCAGGSRPVRAPRPPTPRAAVRIRRRRSRAGNPGSAAAARPR